MIINDSNGGSSSTLELHYKLYTFNRVILILPTDQEPGQSIIQNCNPLLNIVFNKLHLRINIRNIIRIRLAFLRLLLSHMRRNVHILKFESFILLTRNDKVKP